ncbi:helix-turn-helix transcriptional regulator [Pediococcus acidilactici]
MQNRIRALRKELHLTLPQMSKKLEKFDLKLTPDAISKYEREDREPKLATWQKLADFFSVPVGYLQGLTDDKDGWKLWEDNTGYSREAIEEQISRLIDSKLLSVDAPLQSKISLAVKYLEGAVRSNKEALKATLKELRELDNHIRDRFFIDPKKKEKNGNTIDILRPNRNIDESLFYDDMDQVAYEIISDVIYEAIDKLQEYNDEYPFNKG